MYNVKEKLPPVGLVVHAKLENTGGGWTTYEDIYDKMLEFEDGSIRWADGDGEAGRTTVAWDYQNYDEMDGNDLLVLEGYKLDYNYPNQNLDVYEKKDNGFSTKIIFDLTTKTANIRSEFNHELVDVTLSDKELAAIQRKLGDINGKKD